MSDGDGNHSFRSSAYRRATLHTVSLLEPIMRPGDAILDVGCGAGYVLWWLRQNYPVGDLVGIDIVDIRLVPVPRFQLYDGVHLPLESSSFDIVMFNFVLHHVPDEKKLALISEAVRVSRRHVFVMEDTPRNFLDRFMNRRHGEQFRRSIGSTADFGFYTCAEWEALFPQMGLTVEQSLRLPRFNRARDKPHARTAFVLGKA